MSVLIHVLVLDDSNDDARMAIDVLRQAGYEVDWTRVETEADYSAVLDPSIDLIIADYRLPLFDGLSALKILRARGLHIPFIIVSGAIGEDQAVNAIKQGAADYLLKDRLARLGAAVEHALQIKVETDARRAANAALEASEERYRLLAENATDMIARVTPDGVCLYVSPACRSVLGYEPEELIGQVMAEFVHPDNQPEINQVVRVKSLQTSETLTTTFQVRRKDKRYIWIESTSRAVRDESGAIKEIIGILRDISARKRTEEQLRKLSRAVEQSANVVVITNMRGDIEYVNPKFTELTQYTAAEVIGKNPRILKSGLTPPEVYQQLWVAISAGVEWHGEIQNKKKNGDLYWEWLSISGILDEQGVLTHFVGISEDITERKKDEVARQLLAAIVESSDDAIIGKAVDGVIVSWNKSAERMYGYTAAEAVGESITMLIPRDRPGEFPSIMNRILRGESVSPFETVRKTKNGTLLDISLAVSPIKNLQGIVTGASAIARDITEKKRIEIAELEQRKLAEALRDTAAVLSSSLDPRVVMRQILENLSHVLEYGAANIILIEEDTVRAAYWQGYPPELEPVLSNLVVPLAKFHNLEEMAATGMPCLIPDTRSDPDWVNVSPLWPVASYIGVPIKSREYIIGFLSLDSSIMGHYSSADIGRLQAFADQAAIALENAHLYDELRRHAADLEERIQQRTLDLTRTKEHVEAILNSTSDAILVVRMDGTISKANSALGVQFGYDPRELIGQHWLKFFRSAQALTLAQEFGAVLTAQQPIHLELEVQRRDGNSFHADIAVSLIVHQVEGPPLGASDEIIISIRDLTVRKRAEDQLRKALEQEKELGELKDRFTSMVSHEFRTPMTVIRMSSELMSSFPTRFTEERKLKFLLEIQAQIKYMVQLLDDVLIIGKAQAHKIQFNPLPLDAKALSKEILERQQFADDGKHQFNFVAEGDLGKIPLDEPLIQHILVNLLSNAVKYSPANTTVTFEVTREANEVVFRLKDQGIGIPQADLAHLFETFHRANNVGQVEGTGLGLAIVKANVETHGGTISCDTQENVGTTFTVRIPVISRNTTSV